MSRQRFLHHYLPAHLASALIAGATLNFILIEAVNYPISALGTATRMRLRPVHRARFNPVAWGVVAALLAIIIGMFLYTAPLTYGHT
jgi:dolichyl-phosphate-mannose-protein mannosyltransferase